MKTAVRYHSAMQNVAKAGIFFVPVIAALYVTAAHAQEPRPTEKETIVLAGGCFWGMEAVFEHTKGVVDVVSGYAGGSADTAHYNIVSEGDTGHAEAVKVTYDPSHISLDTVLDIYFNIAHNPTQLNYQGPDHGTQYRSAVFYADDVQKNEAETKIKALDSQHAFAQPVVTKLEKLDRFYPAEDYHQNYAALHPTQPYIVFHDAPKVVKLKDVYPDLYKENK